MSAASLAFQVGNFFALGRRFFKRPRFSHSEMNRFECAIARGSDSMRLVCSRTPSGPRLPCSAAFMSCLSGGPPHSV